MVDSWVKRGVLAAALIAATQVVVSPAATVSASPTVSVENRAGYDELTISGSSMGHPVRVDVIHASAPIGPAPASAPTLYLLDGTAARDDQPASSWILRTDILNFMKGKRTNVVMPVGGGGTLYTDWQQDDPTLGHLKWETFLTTELPPIIDTQFGGNGRNAIAGLSAGGMAAASIASRFPALYKAVGSYSTCLLMSNPVGQAIVRGSVISRGGNPANMWGPPADPDWAAHDPSQHLDKLRGKPFYVSVGTGVPGPLDLNFNPLYSWPTDESGAIAQEQGAFDCTKAFQIKAKANGVSATFKYNLIGTHSWPYWQNALHDSWATLRTGLGV